MQVMARGIVQEWGWVGDGVRLEDEPLGYLGSYGH